MTFLHQTQRLKNRYFVLRHGQSHANIQGVILSDLHDGQLETFTLTEEGEQQVRASVETAEANDVLGQDTIIISSPFSRCRRTAEIAKEVLESHAQIIFDERLRERWFGNWERKDNGHYADVWADDKIDSNHINANVESATDVQRRTASLIQELEHRHEGKRILLVSHGDALQIMQTGFAKASPSVHRELEHLQTAEIRELHLAL